MNKLNLNPAGKFFLHAITAIAFITFHLKPIPIHAQGLVFKNAALVSGTAGTNGAVYRYTNVTTNVDALVTISNNIEADRMYSFWFKSFSCQVPVQSTLPVTLSSFTAKKINSAVVLNWSTEVERNTSHFVIERSTNGPDFTDAGIIFTDGNADTHREYRFTDDFKSTTSTILYYRLKIVDLNGTYKQSAVRIIGIRV